MRVDASPDRIELIPVTILNSLRPLVEEMRQTSKDLGLGLGWHYLLDLSWAASALGPSHGEKVIDAGAGIGVMQWWLAAQGVDVLSADRTSRGDLPLRFRSWCQVQGLRPDDLPAIPRPTLAAFLPPGRPWKLHRWPGKVHSALLKTLARKPTPPRGRGTVTIYNHDMADLSAIPDNSMDATVSISALEHNEPDTLQNIVHELIRILKPGRKLVATMHAAKEQDWFHESSRGWCYTETTLRNMFDLPADCPSNYGRHDELFEALKNCAELRDNLAEMYFKSGDNGMPWGVWDPQYHPVGVVKTKKHD